MRGSALIDWQCTTKAILLHIIACSPTAAVACVSDMPHASGSILVKRLRATLAASR
jgi:hypothetical protein